MAELFVNTIFKCILFNKNYYVLIQILLKFVPKDPIDNKSMWVQVMSWCQIGDRPLPETMLTYR